MPDRKTLVKLTADECYHSIQDFYDVIAEKLGADPEKAQYDCTKVCVSKELFNINL